MIRRPPRSTLSSSSAASDVYKRQSTQSTGSKADREMPGLRRSIKLARAEQLPEPTPEELLFTSFGPVVLLIRLVDEASSTIAPDQVQLELGEEHHAALVLELNSLLERRKGVVHAAGEGRGWMCRLAIWACGPEETACVWYDEATKNGMARLVHRYDGARHREVAYSWHTRASNIRGGTCLELRRRTMHGPVSHGLP
eukprot:TRINITY_DN23076_c0_g1_i1.p1 TRINITY_DN23076_c0_g1~~TRINITY_DN23076_c0_g1_i1.p1  ORF type:complete len:198 (+),score=40.20 TRINITY_DN23076_c0_g1_i1:142-735(+)